MLKSPGISGRECTAELELLSSDAAGKIAWFYGEENPDDFKVIYGNRTSVLVHSSGKKIIGAEHLSAARLMFPHCEFRLNAPQGELPLLDGSATPWVEELERAGGKKEFISTKDLKVKYVINRYGKKFTASLADNLDKILNARTFIFEEDIPKSGLSEELRSCGFIVGEEMRFRDEPAFHKILDFLGDMSLRGNALPAGKFEIYNGGHELHHKIAEQLF